jgi:archaellum component FlaC
VTTDERIEKLGERIDALTMNVELLTADAQALIKTAQQDGENIRALARIAEIHERRITSLEGGNPNAG